MAEHVHFFTANRTGWSWLGGLARATRLRPHGPASGHGYPSRLKMDVLDAGNVVLGPLLRLEKRLGGGCELRVVAQAVGPLRGRRRRR
jgi:hypothetical protein